MASNKLKKTLRKKKAPLKKGLAPGTIIFVGDQKIDHIQISCISYDPEVYEETNDIPKDSIAGLFEDTSKVNWVNINGLHDTSLIEHVGKLLSVDKLILEDLLNTHQRPKLDSLEGYSFCVFKIYHYHEDSQEFDEEQISIIFSESYVVSFQEKEGDIFDSVRDRIRNCSGNVRYRRGDYLSYALMDMLIDNYFFVFEKLSEKIENLEDEIIENPSDDILPKLHDLRKQIAEIRKNIYPLREVVSKLEKDENNLLRADTRIFVKDLYDHTIQVIDNVENFRDSTKSLLELYMSSVSNKMNSVMKVLTVISTIFIPLTFIVGVYGMNFTNMPELGFKYGYYYAWGAMLVVAVLMLYILKRQKWL